MSEGSDNNESTPPEKLLIDNSSDFQFHAAYLAYSDTYDKATSLEIKEQLTKTLRLSNKIRLIIQPFTKIWPSTEQKSALNTPTTELVYKVKENENGAEKPKND